VGEREGARSSGGEMAQTMYAHMNKLKKENKKNLKKEKVQNTTSI
jgi:hypothetical protein